MSTTQKQARKSGGAAAKNAAAAQAAKQKPRQEPTKAPAAKKAQTAPAQPTYRDVEEFTPALKEAKSAAKGNADLSQALGLLTHLSWKTPGGSVGWAKGTTQKVVDLANDLAVPAGTPIPDAMSTVLGAAEKAAADDTQKKAVASLAKVVRGHTG